MEGPRAENACCLPFLAWHRQLSRQPAHLADTAVICYARPIPQIPGIELLGTHVKSMRFVILCTCQESNSMLYLNQSESKAHMAPKMTQTKLLFRDLLRDIGPGTRHRLWH